MPHPIPGRARPATPPRCSPGGGRRGAGLAGAASGGGGASPRVGGILSPAGARAGSVGAAAPAAWPRGAAELSSCSGGTAVRWRGRPGRRRRFALRTGALEAPMGRPGQGGRESRRREATGPSRDRPCGRLGEAARPPSLGTSIPPSESASRGDLRYHTPPLPERTPNTPTGTDTDMHTLTCTHSNIPTHTHKCVHAHSPPHTHPQIHILSPSPIDTHAHRDLHRHTCRHTPSRTLTPTHTHSTGTRSDTSLCIHTLSQRPSHKAHTVIHNMHTLIYTHISYGHSHHHPPHTRTPMDTDTQHTLMGIYTYFWTDLTHSYTQLPHIPSHTETHKLTPSHIHSHTLTCDMLTHTHHHTPPPEHASSTLSSPSSILDTHTPKGLPCTRPDL